MTPEERRAHVKAVHQARMRLFNERNTACFVDEQPGSAKSGFEHFERLDSMCKRDVEKAKADLAAIEWPCPDCRRQPHALDCKTNVAVGLLKRSRGWR